MKIITHEDETIIECDNSLELSSILDLKKILQIALDKNKNIILQASEITQIDTAALQLLASFQLTAKQRKIKCKWRGISPTLLNVAKLLGINKVLEFPD